MLLFNVHREFQKMIGKPLTYSAKVTICIEGPRKLSALYSRHIQFASYILLKGAQKKFSYLTYTSSRLIIISGFNQMSVF